jgi:hephaestin
MTKDINTGLVGNVIVGSAGDATAMDGTPLVADAHREFVTLFATFDENLSLYRDLNILRYTTHPESVVASDPAFKESNKMHTINGFMYCNGAGFEMKQGQRARWYLHAAGGDHGMHTPRWFGNSVSLFGRHVAAPELLPGESKTASMLADSRGRWLFHCEVHDHATAGMRAFLQVIIVYIKTTSIYDYAF